jgi:translation initiation factor IF-2
MVEKSKNKIEENIRAPIVTFMGHVDHGKTSILDKIRKTNVQENEYGGITQHTGAYQIIHNDKKITFIDTPGHAAFTQMRARGGRAADIVVLVIAAEEGVKPQTREAISHIKAAKAPLIVAINKMDKAGADPRKVKQELAQENVLVEDWGGNEICVEISAKTGEGLDKLLDAILLLSEIIDIKADSKGDLEAIIIESRLDRKKGVVVSCIIRNGTLEVGDQITASGLEAKVKRMTDFNGNVIKKAFPSDPVEILGFSDVPHVGDLILNLGSELADLSIDENTIEIVGQDAKRMISIVLKADTQGTLEAVKSSLSDLVTSSAETTYALKFLHTGTGDVNESDVMLAQSGKGVVIGFDVKIPASVEDLAEASGVTVKSYKTIYDLIDDAAKLLEGTAVDEISKIKGRVKVLKIFKLESGDIIAGCKVLAGAIKVKSRVAIYDKNPADLEKSDEPLFHSSVKKLKKGKNDIDVAGKDNECGVLLKPQYEEISEDMYLEVL